MHGDIHLSLIASDIKNLDQCAKSCQQLGATVNCYAVDISDSEATIELITNIASAAIDIDIAYINAGISGNSYNNREPWTQQEKIIQTNLLGAMASAYALVPAMQTAGAGKIVFISSVAAYRGMGLTPAYCASKAGLKSYAESIRGGLANKGIQVHTVLPGFIQTDMSDNFAAARPFMLSSDQAAQRIIKAVDKGQLSISFPRLLAYGLQLIHLLPTRWGDHLLEWLGYGSAQADNQQNSHHS